MYTKKSCHNIKIMFQPHLYFIHFYLKLQVQKPRRFICSAHTESDSVTKSSCWKQNCNSVNVFFFFLRKHIVSAQSSGRIDFDDTDLLPTDAWEDFLERIVKK